MGAFSASVSHWLRRSVAHWWPRGRRGCPGLSACRGCLAPPGIVPELFPFFKSLVRCPARRGTRPEIFLEQSRDREGAEGSVRCWDGSGAQTRVRDSHVLVTAPVTAPVTVRVTGELRPLGARNWSSQQEFQRPCCESSSGLERSLRHPYLTVWAVEPILCSSSQQHKE